jgi:hypothetical protein
MPDYELAHHTSKPPQDIAFWNHDGSLLVTRQGEGYVTLDVVVGETRNPRVLVRHDRAVVEGQLVRTGWNPQLKVVSGHHPMAGLVHRSPVDEWLNEPALLLDEVPAPPESLAQSDE